MRLSENFRRSEFACRCGCGFDTVDAELLRILQDVRNHFGLPLTVVSGCRCAGDNARVGGAPSSQHLFGRAADSYVEGIPPQAVYNYLEGQYPDRLGLGLSKTTVHIDVRNGPAVRWTF